MHFLRLYFSYQYTTTHLLWGDSVAKTHNHFLKRIFKAEMANIKMGTILCWFYVGCV